MRRREHSGRIVLAEWDEGFISSVRERHGYLYVTTRQAPRRTQDVAASAQCLPANTAWGPALAALEGFRLFVHRQSRNPLTKAVVFSGIGVALILGLHHRAVSMLPQLGHVSQAAHRLAASRPILPHTTSERLNHSSMGVVAIPSRAVQTCK